jgi:hypothetical protein
VCGRKCHIHFNRSHHYTATIVQNVDLCTSIADSRDKKAYFSVFPNPNKGSFVIVSEVETAIKVLNTLGELILESKLFKGKNYVDLSGFSNGVYFIKSEGGNSLRVKIIKE